jgi:hypothetical protein
MMIEILLFLHENPSQNTPTDRLVAMTISTYTNFNPKTIIVHAHKGKFNPKSSNMRFTWRKPIVVIETETTPVKNTHHRGVYGSCFAHFYVDYLAVVLACFPLEFESKLAYCEGIVTKSADISLFLDQRYYDCRRCSNSIPEPNNICG